jgi:hypothetical protein
VPGVPKYVTVSAYRLYHKKFYELKIVSYYPKLINSIFVNIFQLPDQQITDARHDVL